MATGDGDPDPLASAQRNAAAARARSVRESNRAERHELLAQQAGDELLRDVHLRMAEVHRSTASCHLTAAHLQEDYVARLAGWAGRRDAPRPPFMAGVAAACGTSSAALTLVGATLDQLAVAASDEPARAAQELEFLLGEGPARDATSQIRPVSASGAALIDRWPGYGPAVAELGISEVAAVPLSLAGTCVGALAVFDPAPGIIGSQGFTEVAEALTTSMILSPHDAPVLYGETDPRDLVHQAAGMLSVQLGCPVPDALELIKAHAFTEGTSAESVATRITQGTLRLG
ncbi:ANTAR domain-containing protein [Streptomyces sp. SID13726]|uniref:ANTAR domain-containing protein n=1 Tax=Streptomyces sp. SID13726 TaxID=2706058 RepID=UPI0013BCF839|nr:ANTAR domain-containing protein [Streptomyces sp. SID13726]NEB05834.1 ANTAR domain-containing protein [Streptomyces sp. SID13726]